MTVNTLAITSGPYSGNDVTVEFDYDFRIENKDQLAVFETDNNGVETELVVDVDYTVDGIGIDGGGSVTRVAGPLPTGFTWYIRSDYKETQLTSFASQGGFFPQVHERAFDKLTFLFQQILDSLGRTLKLSDSDPAGSGTLNNVQVKPSTVVGFNSIGELSNIPFTESGGVTTASQVFDDTRQQSSQVSLDEDQLNIAGNDSDLATNAANINQNAQNILANATAINSNTTAINSNATALASTLAGRDGVYTDTGTANAYVLTSATEAVTAYADGQRFRFRPANDNTGASTVNVSGLGVKTISNASTGFIKAGNLTELEYIAATDDFRIVNTEPYYNGSDQGFVIRNADIEQFGNTTGRNQTVNLVPYLSHIYSASTGVNTGSNSNIEATIEVLNLSTLRIDCLGSFNTFWRVAGQ